MNLGEFKTGVRRGLPVGIGYFSVSFGFGAMAANQGVKALDAALISLTNLTSAGQFAGLTSKKQSLRKTDLQCLIQFLDVGVGH